MQTLRNLARRTGILLVAVALLAGGSCSTDRPAPSSAEKLERIGKGDNPNPVIEKALEAWDQFLTFMDALGLEAPPVYVVAGDGASTDGTAIYMGIDLLANNDISTIMQIMAHEAGHIYEGHNDAASEAILQAMLQEGLITQEQYVEIQQNHEHQADVWAALAAWVFDANPEWPGISQWLTDLNEPASDTHPDSGERALTIALMTQVFDALAETNFFDGELGGEDGLFNEAHDNHEQGEFGAEEGWDDFDTDDVGWDDGGDGWDNGGDGGLGGDGDGDGDGGGDGD